MGAAAATKVPEREDALDALEVSRKRCSGAAVSPVEDVQRYNPAHCHSHLGYCSAYIEYLEGC